MSGTAEPEIALDLAGGRSGGAGRFREQWAIYASGRPALSGVAIGSERSVSPDWLIRRELAVRGRSMVIAANNVGFFSGHDRRITLLANANHFLTPEEWGRSRPLLGRLFGTQIRIVRAAARRSELLVAPSSDMAARIVAQLPDVADRVVVRFHPAAAIPLAASPEAPPVILCPIVDSPFKKLAGHLLALQQALGKRPVRVVCTSPATLAPSTLRQDGRFEFCGVLPRERLAQVYAITTAVYYPTAVESFGYPLAEARASGLAVIAQQSAHNAEIAGSALRGFTLGSLAGLTTAVDDALASRPLADPEPFVGTAYFDWLMAGGAVT